jgi:hypothetical protein
MDILDIFLNKIAYKFPKGYPDLNNSNDVSLLYEELERIGIDLTELHKTNHWNDRLRERGTILDITNYSKDYPIPKLDLIPQIEAELLSRARELENIQNIPISFTNQVAYKILTPILLHNDEDISLNLKVKYTTNEVEKEGIGTLYVAVINENNLITLLLVAKDSQEEIEKSLKTHMLTKDKPLKPITILTRGDDYKYILNPITPTQNIFKIDPETLSYTPKTDYRKGSKFSHKTYGEGIVVNTSSGSKGTGNPQGKLDWVEVKFEKPYLKAGKLLDTRIINNVHTLLSPALST